MEINREYVSDVDTDTASDAELDYKAKKCASRTWKCCRALTDVPPEMLNMKNGLFEKNTLLGFVLTTNMGGKTVIGRYMTVWILQNGILSQWIASSRKKVTG